MSTLCKTILYSISNTIQRREKEGKRGRGERERQKDREGRKRGRERERHKNELKFFVFFDPFPQHFGTDATSYDVFLFHWLRPKEVRPYYNWVCPHILALSFQYEQQLVSGKNRSLKF